MSKVPTYLRYLILQVRPSLICERTNLTYLGKYLVMPAMARVEIRYAYPSNLLDGRRTISPHMPCTFASIASSRFYNSDVLQL